MSNIEQFYSCGGPLALQFITINVCLLFLFLQPLYCIAVMKSRKKSKFFHNNITIIGGIDHLLNTTVPKSTLAHWARFAHSPLITLYANNISGGSLGLGLVKAKNCAEFGVQGREILSCINAESSAECAVIVLVGGHINHGTALH